MDFNYPRLTDSCDMDANMKRTVVPITVQQYSQYKLEMEIMHDAVYHKSDDT